MKKSRSNEPLCMRARLLAHMQKWQPALRDYNTLIELDNAVPAWFNERGHVYAKLGKTTPRQAISPQPKNCKPV